MQTATQIPEALSFEEQRQAQTIERLLQSGVPELVSPAGDKIELPSQVFAVLKKAVGFMALGQTVTLVTADRAITTQKAADILDISRPFFIQLLESGAMAYHRVGNQRRVFLREVLEFQRKRQVERLAALDRLTREAFDDGLYDRNVFPESGTEE